jgi:hypothetical protein
MIKTEELNARYNVGVRQRGKEREREIERVRVHEKEHPAERSIGNASMFARDELSP